MVSLNEMIYIAWLRQFYHTPYKSGNLARSIGTFGSRGNEASYVMFDSSQSAPYGALLNELSVINYQTTLRGKVYKGSYVNKHFGWVDKYVDAFADELDLMLGSSRG